MKIFDDRIEVFNPGGLPPELTLAKLLSNDYRSLPRNKQVADVFKTAGLIEKYGSGIRRILSDFEAEGLPAPVFAETCGGFSVTLYRNAFASGAPQKTPQKNGLGDRLAAVIATDPSITRRELAKRLGISENTVKEYLAKLKAEGRLEREGSDRAGEWKVREPGIKYRRRR